jgi:hypothetical protein
MRTPQEIIDHVAGIVRQKQEKGMKCFYTIKVFKNDATNELITRKAACPDFLQDVQQIISENKPDAVVVELYKGSSYKVKEPESVFDINLIGREVSFPARVETLGGIDSSMMFNEMRRNFDQQMQGFRELAGLHSTLTVSQLELKYAQEKIKELEKELKEAEEYIDHVEKNLRTRPQLGGPGGLNLLELGSHLLEGVLRRNPSLLAGVSGLSENQVKGLFTEKKVLPPATDRDEGTAKASVKPEEDSKELTERDQMRVQVIEEIAGFLRKLSDYHLRGVYELMHSIGKDLSLLEKFKQVANNNTATEQDTNNEQ